MSDSPLGLCQPADPFNGCCVEFRLPKMSNPNRPMLGRTACWRIHEAETGGGDRNESVGKAVDMYSPGVPRGFSSRRDRYGSIDNWLLYHNGASGAEGHIKSTSGAAAHQFSGKIFLSQPGGATQRNGTEQEKKQGGRSQHLQKNSSGSARRYPRKHGGELLGRRLRWGQGVRWPWSEIKLPLCVVHRSTNSSTVFFNCLGKQK
jgi:hypothetical protein